MNRAVAGGAQLVAEGADCGVDGGGELRQGAADLRGAGHAELVTLMLLMMMRRRRIQGRRRRRVGVGVIFAVFQSRSSGSSSLPRFLLSSNSPTGETSVASATVASASAGHGRNQSIAHFEKIAGNCPTRAANRAPTGERHSSTWSLSRTRAERKARRESGVSGCRWRGVEEEGKVVVAEEEELAAAAAAMAEARCASRNCGRTSEASASSSSRENIPATSPVPRNWLMYSRKASSRTSPSLRGGFRKVEEKRELRARSRARISSKKIKTNFKSKPT